MKKKVILIIVLLSLILFFIIFSIIDNINIKNNKMFYKRVDEINELFALFENPIYKYGLHKTGTLTIDASYRGAHGESYPHTFEYKFLFDNTDLYMENESGYEVIDLKSELSYAIDKLSNGPLNISIKKIRQIKNKYQGEIDLDKINKTYGTDLKIGYITFDVDGVFYKRIIETKITLDNAEIEIDNNNHLNVITDNHEVSITTTRGGYSLDVDDEVKMNVFTSKDKDSYSIIFNKRAYVMEMDATGFSFEANSPASIYTSLMAKFNFSEEEITKEKENIKKDNPLKKYMSNLN